MKIDNENKIDELHSEKEEKENEINNLKEMFNKNKIKIEKINKDKEGKEKEINNLKKYK